jgi:hypothetical protein
MTFREEVTIAGWEVKTAEILAGSSLFWGY